MATSPPLPEESDKVEESASAEPTPTYESGMERFKKLTKQLLGVTRNQLLQTIETEKTRKASPIRGK